ncbi:hypothetical protein [Cryobacterium sp. TMT2-4]|uniref:hypothetical protein n=1 Tax=Cryobacterium sp. TMT2-4 TaxID=1259254 RepID=UPI00106CE95E|nr:hypothetical protein [Cryobacterium sp. TMT2-4]TFC66174.1 hypothetical protein E3O54_10990 [Cryobacterium sp. TMT2-4]
MRKDGPMIRSRLIVLEGVAGSGKSTLASYIADLLHARGVRCHLIVEGCLDHPADYESAAWLSGPEYAHFLEQHASDGDPIERSAEPHDGGFLVPYGKLQAAGLVGTPALDALAAYDVYELAEPIYRRLVLQRWQAFAKRASAEPDTWVLDCCMLHAACCMLHAAGCRTQSRPS